MNQPFPFGFPLPTAFYLTLYVVTLVIHVLFMNYVLAGSAFLAWASWFRGGAKQRHRGRLALTLRDWMPAALSAAITAGVAPLLFIQILYKHDFYTANLLLFHRWMLILPVLIVGFYTAYLLKAKRVGDWPVAARAAVGVGMFLCFAFVAYSWTENHLLSLEPDAMRGAFYASGKIIYHNPQKLPRLAVWFTGAFPVMATIAAWQLWYADARSAERVNGTSGGTSGGEYRRLQKIALAGVVIAGLCAVLYFWLAPAGGRAVVTGPLALPYMITALVGGLAVVVGWLLIGRGASVKRGLTVATVGVVVMVIGTTVVREALRLHELADRGELESLYHLHADAARIGGLAVFLTFFAVNAALIVWCFRLVRRSRK